MFVGDLDGSSDGFVDGMEDKAKVGRLDGDCEGFSDGSNDSVFEG